MSDSPWIRDISEADFQREVLDRSRELPVVVDFWAPWCGPCRMLGPILEKLVNERKGEVVLVKLNVDEAQQRAAEYGIDSIPAVKAFRNGKVVLEFFGLLPESHVAEFLNRVLPSETDRLVDAAARLEPTDPAAAVQAYRRILEKERNHEAALVGLARVLIGRGEKDEPEQLLERVVAHGELGMEVDRLRSLLALGETTRNLGHDNVLRRRVQEEPNNAELHYELGCLLAAKAKYDDALPELLTAAKLNPDLGRNKVKDTMVKIFQVIGARSELADEYRDKLQKVLY